MNITVDAATASIISAIVVGFVTLMTTIIANSNSFRQQQAQLDRQERKAEIEDRQADKDREQALKKDLASKLQEIYGSSIASLTTLMLYDDGAKRAKPEYAANLAEVQKWLSFVVASHYDKASEGYASFLKLYGDTQDSYKGYGNIEKLREMMIEFVSKDPRLHS